MKGIINYINYGGNLNRTKCHSYGKTNEFYQINPQVVNYPRVMTKPLLNAMLSNRDHKVWTSPHSQCLTGGIRSHIYYGIESFDRGTCLDPAVLSLVILSGKLNMTPTVGGLITGNEIAWYNQVSITAFRLEPSMMTFLNPVFRKY